MNYLILFLAFISLSNLSLADEDKPIICRGESKDCRFLVNKAGVLTPALRIEGTGNVTVGNTGHTGTNELGGNHKIIGVITPGVNEAGDASGGISIWANAYGGASFPYRSQTAPGGASLRIIPRTGDTSAAFVFQTNLAAASTTTTASTIGQATQAGAWTLGPGGFGGRHTFNIGTAGTASAGSNGAPPAQVAGYMEVTINGVGYKIPYYNN